MASNPPKVQDGRRGGRLEASRRRGLRLALSVSVTAGSVGGSYLAGIRLTHLGHLALLGLPHDALLLLIIIAGIAVIVLGWRVIVYLDQRNRRHHETISRMLDQEGVYQKYEDNSSTYERWAMAAVPHGEQSPRRPRRSPPQTETNGHEDVVPLDRHHRAIPGTPRGGAVADHGAGQPGTAGESRPTAARALTGEQSARPELPLRSDASRTRSPRHR